MCVVALARAQVNVPILVFLAPVLNATGALMARSPCVLGGGGAICSGSSGPEHRERGASLPCRRALEAATMVQNLVVGFHF